MLRTTMTKPINDELSIAKTSLGNTDLPLSSPEADYFEMGKYYEGLADFIERCQTPMTIAIQGDWGTGKTSTMNIIENILEERSIKRTTDDNNSKSVVAKRTQTVFFNTWQFSQFNLGDTLIFALISQITQTLMEKKELNADAKEKLKEFANSGLRIMTTVLKYAWRKVEDKAGMSGLTQEVVSDYRQAQEEIKTGQKTEPSLVESLRNLRANFENTIQEFLNQTGNDRVVIFIDDLDRLEPAKAVEVLEALKLFFESKNCVFVLAIDFSVVSQGISSKYGSDLSERKARSFFDKIIQVPFQLPVSEYEPSRLLKETLGEIDLSDEAEGDRSLITEITQCSVGTVPRSIKRLVNTFLLLENINSQKSDDTKRIKNERLARFYWLCAQSAYPELNELLSLSKKEELRERIKAIADEITLFLGDDQELSKELETWHYDVNELSGLRDFLKLYEELSMKIGQEEIEAGRAAAELTSRGGKNIYKGRKGTMSHEDSIERFKWLFPESFPLLEALLKRIEDVDKDHNFTIGKQSSDNEYSVYAYPADSDDSSARRVGLLRVSKMNCRIKFSYKCKEDVMKTIGAQLIEAANGLDNELKEPYKADRNQEFWVIYTDISQADQVAGILRLVADHVVK
ncbi:hypothetical protein BSR28_07020 [Boudabousia liubingyangii]|nr:hypothetical protein BSR28_07020 [Boudabousia liubingyangii]